MAAKTLYDKYRKETQKAFNYPSNKLVSDGDILKHLRKQKPQKITTKEALAVLVKALKKDSDYSLTWEQNIAMVYVDAERNFCKEKNKKVLNKYDKFIVANRAAKNFVDLLCAK